MRGYIHIVAIKNVWPKTATYNITTMALMFGVLQTKGANQKRNKTAAPSIEPSVALLRQKLDGKPAAATNPAPPMWIANEHTMEPSAMTEKESGLSAGYALVVSFPDQSPSFCYGFEAGQLNQQMKFGLTTEIEETTRIENREVIRRCAEYLGWRVEVTPSEIEGWDLTKLIKVSPRRDRPNPHGLKVVATPPL